MATGLARCSGPGLQNKLSVHSSKGRAGSGRPGTGRLDHTQAHWISWALLATASAFRHSGTRSKARAWSRHEHQEVPAVAGATQGDLRPSAAHPPEHLAQSINGGHWQPDTSCCLDGTWLGVGLHRPERLRAKGLSRRRPWPLVSCSLSLPYGHRGTDRPGQASQVRAGQGVVIWAVSGQGAPSIQEGLAASVEGQASHGHRLC